MNHPSGYEHSRLVKKQLVTFITAPEHEVDLFTFSGLIVIEFWPR